MAGTNRFARVKKYKVLKFKQQVQKYCLGTCFLWIENKLTKPTTLQKLTLRGIGWSSMFDRQRGEAGPSAVSDRIRDITNDLQAAYTRHVVKDGNSGGDYTGVEAEFPKIVRINQLQRLPGDGSTGAELARIMRQVGRGQATVIACKYGQGIRHAMAIYRDREGIFQFFDPSAGLYQFEVTQIDDFCTNFAEADDETEMEDGSYYRFSTYRRK